MCLVKRRATLTEDLIVDQLSGRCRWRLLETGRKSGLWILIIRWLHSFLKGSSFFVSWTIRIFKENFWNDFGTIAKKIFKGIGQGVEIILRKSRVQFNLKHFRKNLKWMKNFIKSLWKFLTSLKNIRRYYWRKLLRTFRRNFLKICGNISENIWNYFTNISRKFSDFLLWWWWGEEGM